MPTLYLRNCIMPFTLRETQTIKDDHIIDDECVENASIIEVYCNSDNKVTLIFEQFRCDEEERFDESSEIINCITTKAYEPLIDYINTTQNITIYISQVYGTISDYTIYPNTYLTSYEKFRSKEFDIQLQTECINYKYLIYKIDAYEKFI